MKQSGKNRSKSLDWYSLNQRFSIRKYHFGATSVLLGTALLAGSHTSQAQANDLTESSDQAPVVTQQPQESATLAAGQPASSQAVIPADEQGSQRSEQSPTQSQTATTEDQTLPSPDLQEGTSGSEQASEHVSDQVQVSDQIPAIPVTSEQEQSQQSSDQALVQSSETLALEPSLASAPDSSQVQKEAQVLVSQTADQPSLERQSTQAVFSNQSAQLAAQAALDKKAAPQSSQPYGAMAAAVVDLRRQGRMSQAQAKDLMLAYAAGSWSDQELAQVLASYGADQETLDSLKTPKSVASQSLQPLSKPQKTVVANLKDLTADELDAIRHEVLVANPQLSSSDMSLPDDRRDRIQVRDHTDGSGNEAGDVTVTYIDPVSGETLGTQKLLARDTVLSQASLANQDQLANSINWFSLSKATRIYQDGTKAYPDGRVTYADGTSGTTQDQRFRDQVAKFVTWDSDPSGKTYEALQEGMVLEIPTSVEGYELRAQVVKLAPRAVATDPVRDQLGQASNATRLYPKDDALAAQGKANGQVYRGNDANYQQAAPADIILVPQDAKWSHLSRAGIAPQGTSDDQDAGLLAFSSNKNDANVGVTLAFSATYKGKPVAANVLVADAEEAGLGELLQFETDGQPWQPYTTVFSGANPAASTVRAMTAQDLAVPDNSIINSFQNAGYKAQEWVNQDASGKPIIYGGQLFGPLYTKIAENPVAIAMSQDVSNLSIYINAYGMQSAMIGFVAEDLGDAPTSYGQASHVLGSWSDQLAGNTPVIHTQPYLGTVAADANFAPNSQAQPLLEDDQDNDADEGENQLVTGSYTLRQSTDNSYVFKGVRANPGQNNTQAYARAWADFNNNGQFDADEASNVVTVAADGSYDFSFEQVPQNWDTSQDTMAMRIRIGLTESEILSPTGRASSGEVEDFQVNVQQASRGQETKTSASQAQTQTARVGFEAYGKTLASDFQAANTMDTSRPAKIVLADGQLVDRYTEPGQGTYQVQGWDGDHVLIAFTPDPSFTGTAKGVVLRAWDANQADTGWRVSATTQQAFPAAANTNQAINGNESMDAVYIPSVTPLETDTVTRTIRYQYQDGTPVASDRAATLSQSVSFERAMQLDAAGHLSAAGDWTVSQGQADLERVLVPVLTGYLADRSELPAVSLAAGDPDLTEVITYRKLGSYLPQAPAGEAALAAIPYPNDPTDATRTGQQSQSIPYLSGYTAYSSDGQALTPIDASDPSKGYQAPAIPADATQDTPITYSPDNQVALISFVDQADQAQLASLRETGLTRASIDPTNYQQTLKRLVSQGYQVASDDFAGAQTFDKDTARDQVFTINLYRVANQQTAKITFSDQAGQILSELVETGDASSAIPRAAYEQALRTYLKAGYQVETDAFAGQQVFDDDLTKDQTFPVVLAERVETVDASQPPFPGNPVDPGNPNSPVWPNSVGVLVGREGVSRQITYLDATDGKELAQSVTQTLTFKRQAKINLVTGQVTYGDWQGTKTTFDPVLSPVLSGYLADLATVPEQAGIAATDPDRQVSVTYRKLGSYLPQAPTGLAALDPIAYPNDPTDASKPGIPVTPIPDVEGYKPVDSTGQALRPIDPADPSKGYQPPALPADPTQDTPISYVKSQSQLQVRYVDETGQDLLPSQTLSGQPGASYTTTAPVIQGYLLTAYPTNARGSFGTSDNTVTYVYREIGSYQINVPGQGILVVRYPNDPNDPTKLLLPTDPNYPRIPYVLGYIPVDPETGLPLAPFSTGDPRLGYVPPVPKDPSQDTTIDYVQYVPANPSDPGQMINPGTPSPDGRRRQPQLEEKQHHSDKSKGAHDQYVTSQDSRVLPQTGDQAANTVLAGALALMTAGLLSLGKAKKDQD